MKTRLQILLDAYVEMIRINAATGREEHSHMLVNEIRKMEKHIKEEMHYLPMDGVNGTAELIKAQVELVKIKAGTPGDQSVFLAKAHDFIGRIFKLHLKNVRSFE